MKAYLMIFSDFLVFDSILFFSLNMQAPNLDRNFVMVGTHLQKMMTVQILKTD
jgi:hypothetical protein